MAIVKEVVVQLHADSAEAQRKLDEIAAEAKRLGELNPEIKVQIDKSAVTRGLAVLRGELKAASADQARIVANTDQSGRGLISRLLFGQGRGLAGLQKDVSSAFQGANGITGVIGALGSSIGSLASLGAPGLAAIAAIAAAVAGLVSVLGSVIPALAAAGFGLAGFAALAAPTIIQVVKGYGAITKAQLAYTQATTSAARKTALQNLKDEYASLTPAQNAIVKGIQQLDQAWQDLAKTVAPGVLKVFNDGLKIARILLPQLVPFARTAASALNGLLKGVASFLQSGGFKQFLAQMQSFAGPAITALGQGLGKIVISLGKLLQGLATPAGVATLRIVLEGVALAIDAIALAFKGLNTAVFAIIPAFLRGLAILVKGAGEFSDQVLSAFQAVINGASDLANIFLPGSGIAKGLASQAKAFDAYRQRVHDDFVGASNSIAQFAQKIANAPKIFTLKGDISDLQNKLATAEQALKNPDLTKTRRAQIEANISQLQQQLARAKAELLSLQGTTVTTFVQNVQLSTLKQFAATHHAAGGITSGGLALVGEAGPELLALPRATRVYNNAQTNRIIGSQGSGGQTVNISQHFSVPPNVNMAELGRVTVTALREFEKRSGKGWRS